MSLHRLKSVTIGVPNVAETAAYYQAFGLTETAPGRLATTDGGEQLILVESAQRRLVALGVVGSTCRSPSDRPPRWSPTNR